MNDTTSKLHQSKSRSNEILNKKVAYEKVIGGVDIEKFESDISTDL